MANDIIKQLPDSVANQIAAGEVIQRPASVVKELVENAVDAGAKSIQIILKDAGRTLVQVIDDGKGMTPTDARMAFERHATSKISSADDLLSLLTMGFRGEALPSIASVAQVELRTRPADETLGSRLIISENIFERQEPCNTPVGTNIMVKNIFFHMPARRKYLKKDSVELGHILREFERLALVNPSIQFKIVHNDTTLHQLPAGNLKQRIESLFGHNEGGKLIPIGTETSIVKISGFVGSPAHAKKRNSPQFFFVNGRNMRHPYFHKAVLNCYSELISADSQPSYFINFEIDPSTIDVNIHPQKHEIKFEHEQDVWQILSAAIRQALGKANVTGALDFDMSSELSEIPVFSPDSQEKMPDISLNGDYNPFNDNGFASTNRSLVEHKSKGTSFGNGNHTPRDWDKLYESFNKQGRNINDFDNTNSVNKDFVDDQLGQQQLFGTDNLTHNFITIDNRYIALPTRNGITLIHRRRAHIRITYDKIIQRIKDNDMQSQRLIFPETICLTPTQTAILPSLNDSFIKLGFDLSYIGDNVWAINAVPALQGKMSPGEAISKIAADIENQSDINSTAIIEPMALALAKSSAFNHANEVSDSETEALINNLLSCKEPSYTPDGLIIIHNIDNDEIQRFFS